MTASSFDWSGMRARVDEARARFERAASPDSAETRRILKARAVALAVSPTPEPEEGILEVVEFVLAHETWAIESSFIREIRTLTGLTPLPCTPHFVLGIVTIRGEILSVIDIRRFFDLPPKGLPELDKIMVIESGPMTFCILADAIRGLGRIPLSQVQQSLPTLTGIREQYLRGVTPDRKVVLDVARLAADPAILVREQVAILPPEERPGSNRKESKP